MEEKIKNFYSRMSDIVRGSVIDLSQIDCTHPWVIGEICLLLIERQSLSDKSLVLPKNPESLHYLRRMHFDKFLTELGYEEARRALDAVPVSSSEDLHTQEIVHCRYVDEFSARLGRFEKMFKNFGLNDDDAKRALVIVGELGNNVFDHNLGSWPTNFSGAIIAAQHYPETKRIEVVIGDAGVGFLGSLHNAFPDLSRDVEAIKKGLEGYTGRVGEKRGNGLKLVQRWTITNFHGTLLIRSGGGLIHVDEDGTEEQEVPKVLGTLAQFMIYYK